MLTTSSLLAAAAVLATLLAGCGREPAAPGPWQGQPLALDFGMVAHGDVATKRIAIDFPRDRGPMVPLAFRGNCSCAAWAFVAVARDGSERRSLGRADVEHAVLPEESLFLELTLDTRRKEAAEQAKVTSAGEVLLVDLGEKYGRVSVPLSFTYGIDAPVELRPFAHVDFGALPLSRRFSITLELHAKGKPDARFGPAHVDDPRVQATLRRDGETTLLDVRVVPDRGLGVGALRTSIAVDTDLANGYVVPIPVTGQFVDDVEVRPMERISFGRLDLATEQTGEVLLRDYDDSRPPQFVVLGIRAVVGKNLEPHFEARLEPVDGDERSARLVLRYKGTYRTTRAFRGFVDVGKLGGTGSVVSIEFVGFGNE